MSKRLAVPVLVIILLIGAVALMNRGPESPPDDQHDTDTPTETTVSHEAPEEEHAEEPVDEPTGPKKGVSLSPEAYSTDEFLRFFQIASDSGDFISWVGDVANLEDTGSAPYVLYNVQNQFEFEPMIITGYFSQATGELHRELSETNRQYMIDAIVSYVTNYEPEYLGFGVEINTFAKTNPEGYAEFVPFYDEVYVAVKEAHPSTKVFTVFQLEQMKGLDGGLFGGVNDLEQSTWETLDDFKTDLAVFTTYPCLIYRDPSDIPVDYYSEITEYTSKPIAFTEMGWYREDITGWESSVEKQAEFIAFYFNATAELTVEFETWSFLFDQDTFVPFKSMGLLQIGETTSVALDAWINR